MGSLLLRPRRRVEFGSRAAQSGRVLAVLLLAGLALVLNQGPATPPVGATALPAATPASSPCATQVSMTPHPGQGLTGPALRALEQLPAQLAAQAAQLPGLSLGVVVDQELVLTAGFGCADIANAIPVTPQTIFKIESVTKVFEAILTMQQRDAGRFALTDPVAQYVPQVYFLLPNGQTYFPSFLQLVTHSSGLPDGVPNVMTLSQFWTALEQTTAVVPPGTYNYSDLGFVADGQAVSLIAGAPSYHAAVTSSILTPLGMTSSTYDYQPLLGTPVLAIPYLPAMGGGWTPQSPQGYATGFPLAGDIFTSVADMARFVSLQFRTRPAGGSQVLSCASLHEMWQAQVSTGTGGFTTIGWFNLPFGSPTTGPGQGRAARPYTLISKNGGSAYWAALVRFVPEVRLGVIAFSNTGSGNAAVLLEQVEKTVYETLAPLLPYRPLPCAPPSSRPGPLP
jgi:CubicO group peptidase (beta-lactamase class C family)